MQSCKKLPHMVHDEPPIVSFITEYLVLMSLEVRTIEIL